MSDEARIASGIAFVVLGLMQISRSATISRTQVCLSLVSPLLLLRATSGLEGPILWALFPASLRGVLLPPLRCHWTVMGGNFS